MGLIKANGFWGGSEVYQMLLLEELFNEIGNPNPGSYPTGTFTVELYWLQTGTVYLPNTATDKRFCVKVSGRSGAVENYDTIKVVPVNAL